MGVGPPPPTEVAARIAVMTERQGRDRGRGESLTSDGSVADLSDDKAASLAAACVAFLAIALPDHLLALLDAAAHTAPRTAGATEQERAGVLPPAAGVRRLSRSRRVRRQITGTVAVIVDRPRVVLRVAHPQRLRPVRTGHLVPSGTAARPPDLPGGRLGSPLHGDTLLPSSAAPAGHLGSGRAVQRPWCRARWIHQGSNSNHGNHSNHAIYGNRPPPGPPWSGGHGSAGATFRRYGKPSRLSATQFACIGLAVLGRSRPSSAFAERRYTDDGAVRSRNSRTVTPSSAWCVR